MLLVIVFIGIFVVSIISAASKVPKEATSNRRNKFFKAFFKKAGLLITVTTALTLLTATFLVNFPGNEQRTVSKETYKISQGTVIDSSEPNTLRIIVQRSDTLLEPKNIHYSRLFFETTNIKEIVIQKDEHYHSWFIPWPLYVDTIVTFK